MAPTTSNGLLPCSPSLPGLRFLHRLSLVYPPPSCPLLRFHPVYWVETLLTPPPTLQFSYSLCRSLYRFCPFISPDKPGEIFARAHRVTV
jgi:hypothetical protein